MAINVTDAVKGEDTLAALADERTLLLLSRVARDIRARAQEDAAMDAEDILTQAEEANALDPVG